MSEQMRRLINLIKSDETLQKELKENPIKSQEELIEFAKSHNIELEIADINTELNKEELAKVAGGNIADIKCIFAVFTSFLYRK